MNRVAFYGDGRLPGDIGRGHFEYGPEINGIPSWLTVDVPRELWGNTPDEPSIKWENHCYDHKHLLPYVPLAPGEKQLGYACDEGQGQGVALVKRITNYTVLGCWDRTGDPRGNSWALFWIKGHLSAKDMIEAIKRDFPRIWERITRPRGMAISAQSDPDPEEPRVLEVAEVAEAPEASRQGIEIPDDFFAQAMGERVGLEEETMQPTQTHHGVGVARK